MSVAMLFNRYNWAALTRASSVFEEPGVLLKALASRRAPETVRVTTPIGPVTIALRNLESFKTVFSVFCRGDYASEADRPAGFLDLGANVGVAALYFLSRNPGNRVRCYEPDAANLPFLHRNLAPYGDRVEIVERAVGPEAGTAILFRSEDGKYSSLIEAEGGDARQATEVEAFRDVLAATSALPGPIVVKIDIEGLEPELVRSVDWTDYPQIARVVTESVECSALIARPHERKLRNGYVEDLRFTA
jgi:FkbM family methyltransferase